MYRIVLVDDEPLILAGIASLITWEDHDCTIVGKATNGPSACDIIAEQKPDIVITDIRMPIMNGLELVEKCKADGYTFAFIVLTNLEEFSLARKALTLGATDYLVKIDLNADALVEALDKAKKSCDIMIKHEQHQLLDDLIKSNSKDVVHQYLSRMLLSPASFSSEKEELPPEFKNHYERPFIILCSMRSDNISFEPGEDTYDFRQIQKQILEIIGGITGRTFADQTLLSYSDTVYLLAAALRPGDDFHKTVDSFCSKCNTALKTYFELTAVYGISEQAEDINGLPDALTHALTALDYYYYDSSSPVVYYSGQSFHKSNARTFNINFLKKDLSASIAQNDSEKMASIFSQIIDLFQDGKPVKEHATSACINIYTYLYSLFENEDNSYQDIFPYTINIAEHLNHFNSLSDILEWLQSFCAKLCKLLDDRKNTRSDKLVEQAKRYVQSHYTEKLSLTDIADALNISYGHLSNTFKKYTGTTLSDYIASVKIDHAKELIDTHQYLMYEISDMLGFDNPYYFSKVFKKITGISPREYENRS